MRYVVFFLVLSTSLTKYRDICLKCEKMPNAVRKIKILKIYLDYLKTILICI